MEANTLKVHCVDMFRQRGGRDCGAYSVAYAVELAYGGDPAFVKFRQNKLRTHLIDCIRKNHFTTFPKIRTHKPSGSSYEVVIQAVCQCGRPDIWNDMVQCTSCLRWIHWKCAGVWDPRQVRGDWACMQCLRNSGLFGFFFM